MLKYLGFLLLFVIIVYGGYYLVTYLQDAPSEPRIEENLDA
jgi:hypothetical protein